MKKIHLLYSIPILITLLSGCATRNAPIPENEPLISKPILLGDLTRPVHGVALKVSNYGIDKLNAEVKFHGAPHEVIHHVGGFGVRAGGNQDGLLSIGDIKAERTKPIYIKIDWTRGQGKGTERFVITPEQDNKSN